MLNKFIKDSRSQSQRLHSGKRSLASDVFKEMNDGLMNCGSKNDYFVPFFLGVKLVLDV